MRGSAAQSPSATAPASTPDLGTQIAQSYSALSKRPGDWGQLADLRQRLPSVPKAEIDAELKGLFRTGDIALAPNENRKARTARDEQAGVRIGSQTTHMVVWRGSNPG